MNKHVKRLLVTVTATLALIGAGGITALAAGQITWSGSDDFYALMENLNIIDGKYQTLKDDKVIYENETLRLREALDNKQSELETKDDRIAELEERVSGSQTSKDQLKQAEQDMKDAAKKSEDVLKGME